VFDFELSAHDLAAIKPSAKGSALVYIASKTIENLTTTITNRATFCSATIRSFVLVIYSVLETIKKE